MSTLSCVCRTGILSALTSAKKKRCNLLTFTKDDKTMANEEHKSGGSKKIREMTVTFPGGKRVYTHYKGFTVETDQPRYGGGDESAPAPFDLFLASIAACGGIYVVEFCERRGIPLDRVSYVMKMEKDNTTKMISKISLITKVPPEFPDKYRSALIRAIDLCAVKRHMVNPPEFDIVVEKVSENEVGETAKEAE